MELREQASIGEDNLTTEREAYVNIGSILSQAKYELKLGLYNWRAQRADWNKKPDDYATRPKPRRVVDHDRIFEELTKEGNLTTKVPLPDFIQVLNEVWGCLFCIL